MTDRELIEILERKPTTSTDVIIKAYQLGRYFGRREHLAHAAPRQYDRLCDLVSDLTATLIAESRAIIENGRLDTSNVQ